MTDFNFDDLLAACLRRHIAYGAEDDAAETRTTKSRTFDAGHAGLAPFSDEALAAEAEAEAEAAAVQRGGLAAALARATPDIPRAARLSETEIAALIDRGVDPFAEGETRSVAPPDAPIGAAAARITGILSVLKPDTARAACAMPGALVLVEVSEDRRSWHRTLVHPLLPVLSERVPELATLDPFHVGRLEASSRSGSYREPRPLPAAIEQALSGGRTAVAIGRIEDLPDHARLFLTAPLAPAPLSRDDVCAILKVTHSRTGRIADEAVRERLPRDTALAALPGLVLDAAFAQPSSLRVAEALARFAARAVPAAGSPATTLDRVRGLPGQVREELSAVLKDLRGWQRGELAWSDVPASLLLSGPPGTGKTMIARGLAGALGWSLVETSFSDCQGRDAGHLGTTLRHMRETFENAERQAPCIIFWDEFDSYSVRTSGDRRSDRYMAEIVNGMLALMNRLSCVEGVAFVGATNFPGRIDPALLRSGRCDRKIHVGLPDRTGLSEILDLYLQRDAIPDSDRDALARRLVGRSGADVEALVKRARSRARVSGEPLSGIHLHHAADAVLPPEEADDLHRIAIHEAGHALVARQFGRAIRRVVIHASGGATESRRPNILTPKLVAEDLAITLAGRAAERLVLGDISSGGGHGETSDLATATMLALRAGRQWGFSDSRIYHPDAALHDPGALPTGLREELDARLAEAEQQAEEILRPRTDEISRLADQLLDEREIIFGAQNLEDQDTAIGGAREEPVGPGSDRQISEELGLPAP